MKREDDAVNTIAALTYWVIVALWITVLTVVVSVYVRNRAVFGTAALLIAVLLVDTARNIFENIYFGLYFGSKYGFFPQSVSDFLGIPGLLIIPKVGNVIAASVVLSLLLLRWLPRTLKEKAETENNLRESESRFRLLVDGVKDYAIYMLDRTGRVSSWNTGAERIKGYSAEEIV